jgi:hypothetical protein
MIGLFTKCSRGWFWELMFWLLIVELARVIGDRGPGGYRDCCSRLFPIRMFARECPSGGGPSWLRPGMKSEQFDIHP